MRNPTAPNTLEQGFSVAPISHSESQGAVRICVVVRDQADPASNHFVLLRRTPDARVILGALADATGTILDWLELWWQDSEADLPNSSRDEAWSELTASLRSSDPDAWIELGQRPLAPSFLAPNPWQPVCPDGVVLCQDDTKLAAAKLPPYSGSAARFAIDSQGTFFPLNAEARKTAPKDSAPLLPEGSKAIPLNPGAGALAARRFAPLDLEEFAEILGGKPWKGLPNAKRPFRLNGVYVGLDDETEMRAAGRHFHGGRRDANARLAEALYLKLVVLQQCVQTIASETQRTTLPLLNVSPESFRVSLGAIGGNLPFCWSARVALVRPGDAYALNVPGSRTRYFATRTPPSASIYRPEELGLPRRGTGSVRLRKIFAPADGGLVAEGTLVTQERLAVGPNELLRVRLPVGDSDTLELYGTITHDEALAPGEAAFRTIPLHLDKTASAALKSYEGIPFGHIPFEVLQPLSSPCDLYSLGVIALRLLFAGSEITLASALDSTLSLARAVASSTTPDADTSDQPLNSRILELLESDPRWVESIGPQFVLAAKGDVSFPLEVWAHVLGVIIRPFPGIGSFSFCRDLAAAPPDAPQLVFAPLVRELDRLLVRTHALCFSTWRENNEVAHLLSSYLAAAG